MKSQNGVTPLPAVPHQRKEKYYEKVSDLQYFRCNPDRLIDRISKTFCNEQYRYLAEYSLAASAFFISKTNENVMFEKLKSKLSDEYRAYADKGRLCSKQDALKGQYKAVMRDLWGTQSRTKEQIIQTAKSLFELADFAVKCQVEQEMSAPQMVQEETQSEEISQRLSFG